MPSPTYSNLLKLAGSYVGEEKAKGAIDRQLEKGGTNPDKLTADEVKKLESRIGAVITLYIDDDAKKKEFETKLATIS